jgi:hypothetical protein
MAFDMIIKMSIDRKAYEEEFKMKFNSKIFIQAMSQMLDSFDAKHETMKVEVIYHVGGDKDAIIQED